MIVRHQVSDRPRCAFASDRRLGPDDVGLLCYLVALPEGTSTTFALVAYRFACGHARIRSSLKRLVAAGYVRRARLNDGRGGVLLISDKPTGEGSA